MSEQNVETIREFLAAFNRRDHAACLAAIDPKSSGSRIEDGSRRITGVYRLRAGRIVRFKAFLDPAEARQAAGLRR